MKIVVMRKEGGFTLVEILVVLAITGLITAGLVSFMVSQSRSYSLQEDLQEMEQNARVAMDYLQKELHRAECNVQVNAGGDRISFGYMCSDSIKCTGCSSATYSFMDLGGGYSNYSMEELSSSRITASGSGVGSPGKGFIASFITQDLNGDGTPETPLFQVDNPANPNVVTVTMVARTRRPDPKYTRNNGYRQIVLTRRVVLRN